ncbi:MAG: MFS transporter [Nitrososphaerota archaeon]
MAGNRWVILSWLFIDRIIYTVNWLAISAALPSIGAEMGLDLPRLGLLGTVFLLGVGLFQIPSGVLAAERGARQISLAGLGLSSLFAALSSVAPTFETLLLTRFATGAAMAFFFGPGIGLFSPLFSPSERGLALGIYNTGFHVGSMVALGAWATLIDTIGWRYSLLIPGIAGIALTAVTAVVTRGLRSTGIKEGYIPGLVRVLKDREIWRLSAALTIGGGTWYAVSQFGIVYLSSEAGVTVGTAGLLVSLLAVGSIVGSPLSGKIYDMVRSKVLLLVLINVGLATGLVVLIFHNVVIFSLAMFMLGVFYTASFTISYLLPLQYRHIGERYAPLAIGVINGVQLLGGAVFPTAFAFSVEKVGYAMSWSFMSLLALVAVPFVYRLREP